jgi:hypothetical protein
MVQMPTALFMIVQMSTALLMMFQLCKALFTMVQMSTALFMIVQMLMVFLRTNISRLLFPFTLDYFFPLVAGTQYPRTRLSCPPQPISPYLLTIVFHKYISNSEVVAGPLAISRAKWVTT